MNRSHVFVFMALVAGPTALAAQQRTDGGPRLSGSSFVSARYVTGKTMTVVGSQRIGPAMVVVGAKAKPTANEWMPMIGGGTRVRLTRDVRVTTILVFFDTPGGGSFDLYAFPSARRGAWRLDAVMMLRQPLDGARPRELSINPVTLSVEVLHGVRAGFGGTMSAVEGGLTRFGAGLVGEIAVGGVTITTEVMARGGEIEKRLGYVMRF